MIIYAVFVDMQDMGSGRDRIIALYKNREDAEKHTVKYAYTYIKEWNVIESWSEEDYDRMCCLWT